MLKLFWKSLLVTPAILGATLTLGGAAKALDTNAKNQQPQGEFAPLQIAQAVDAQNPELLNQVESYGTEGLTEPDATGTYDQVTSVNQLRDVEPTAWAFEALRSLVERYGCIVGYPDRTFRGDRALTRWEFAAGLNACLNTMERLLQEGVAVLKEDIDKLKRLMEEYQAELAALGARVDNLDSRVSFLEDHQFSTTTKLSGEVIFAVTDTFGDNDNTQTALQARARLLFSSSFTGADSLKVRLAAGSGKAFNFDYQTTGIDPDGGESFVPFNSSDPTLTQTFNLVPSTNFSVGIDWLAYYVPITLGDFAKFNGYVAGWGGTWYDFVPTNSPFFQDFDGGNGAISTFAQQNAIFRIGGGAGGGLNFSLGALEGILGPTSVSVGYLAGNANNPVGGEGLFNGDYAGLAQINFNLFNFLSIGATYVNSYHTADSSIYGNTVGTEVANMSLVNLDNAVDNDSDYTFNFGGKSVNSYGLQGAISITERISVNAFGTYSAARLLGQGDVDIWSYGAGLAFADVGREGNILGIFGGVQPYVGDRTLPGSPNIRFSTSVPLHLELFYKYQVTDNISITPGVIWLSKPSQARSADDVFVGTLRGTFNF